MTPKVYDEWSSVHQPMKQDQENSRKIDGYYVPIQINVPVIDSSKQSKGGWSFWSRGSQESKSTCTKPIYIGSAICPNIFEPRSTYNPPRLKEFHKKYLETFGNSTVCPNEKEISELAEEHDFRIGVFTLSPETADKLCFLDDPNDPEVSTDSQAATHAGSVEQP
ncbi:hypothetical protein I302_107647 [Kwoniella bestiolae CBS 10118]|uniref:Uncharacterized protein n=1 Tax=Kwoniella bestiolae CBS 10118 TaxID=1296100 RepID=A0A1B9FXZ2_9TREE|nr:hypothetical protein I302_06614 [Kwoniella bestiolae CBS 10118]OCF23631.1 hypothetical protein I302_06614 [Kwoniella bestiolae CBS 10118]